jgi:hypothetical protein
VGAIAVPTPGVLNVALAPGAVAAIALYSQGKIPGDAEGPVITSARTRTWSRLCQVGLGPLSA